MLAGASALALLGARRPELDWPRLWWPRLASGAGVALGGFIVLGSLHHGGPRVYLRHERQDRQHLVMAALIAAGGLTEAAGRTTAPARLGWPLALSAVAAMFLSHEQHGTGEARERSARTHRRLAFGLLATGAARTAEVLGLPGPWATVWPACGLAVAARLLAYREPAGTYEGPERGS